MQFELYRSKDGFRWRLLANNRRIIADSGEAYTRATDCRRAIRLFKTGVEQAAVQELDAAAPVYTKAKKKITPRSRR
jgi:uncharacterized protein YegP (UPF0339 family)